MALDAQVQWVKVQESPSEETRRREHFCVSSWIGLPPDEMGDMEGRGMYVRSGLESQYAMTRFRSGLIRLMLGFLCGALALSMGARASAETQELTLEEALAMAFSGNEDLKIAEEELVRARAQILLGWSEGLPKLTLDARYNRSWLLPTLVFDTPEGRQSFTIGTTNNLTAGVSLRQPLYAGGKVGAGLRAARAFKKLSESAHVEAEGLLHAAVENRFYDVLLAQALVEVTSLALEQARANLSQVTSLRRAGRVSDYEVIRARIRVSNLRPDSLASEKGVKITTLALRNAIGLESGELKPVGAFRTSSPLAVDDLASLVSRGLRDRPEIRQLEMEVMMRREAVIAEKASRRPSLDLVASGQVEMQSNDLGFDSDESQQSWNTGVLLSFPLFDGMDGKARVSAARVDLRQAELRLEKLRKAVRLEVERAYHEMREALERADAREQGVEEAEEGARIARSRYTQGVGTQLEVLDGEFVLTQVRAERIRAQRDFAAALIALELGVGFRPTKDAGSATEER